MIILFFIIFILNILFFLNLKYLSENFKIYDIPDNKRKLHKVPIPLLGGILIYLNLILIFLFNYFNDYNFYFFKSNIEQIVFIIALSFFFIIGLVDDKNNLSSNVKLFLITLIIFVTLMFDKGLLIKKLTFSFYNFEINLGIFSYFFTIICFLLFMNAFNMIDGINGQAATYSIFIFLVFIFKNINIIFYSLILIPLIIFLIFNFKNKIFLGDNGTLPLGYFISYIFIDNYNEVKSFYCDEIFLIMMIPGFELLRLAIYRIIKKKHPFKADRNHIHHLILRKYSYIKTFLAIQFLLILPYISFIFSGNAIFSVIFVSVLYSVVIYRNTLIK